MERCNAVPLYRRFNMAVKKSESKSKKTKTVEVKTEKHGTVIGEYSTSVYDNGKLLSFDIDWDKLKEHMKKVG